jgi:anti-sigma-K factor RskA
VSDRETKAFEFVLGTLSPEDREAFITEHHYDDKLDDNVHFWEGNLNALNSINDTLNPRAKTWNAIHAATSPATSTSEKF